MLVNFSGVIIASYHVFESANGYKNVTDLMRYERMFFFHWITAAANPMDFLNTHKPANQLPCFKHEKRKKNTF